MGDFISEILNTLRQNRLRTALTGFAVAWGIFMLIALLGAGNGLQNALMSNSNVLANSMEVYAGRTTKPYKGFKAGRQLHLDQSDVDGLEIPGIGEYVDEVSPVLDHADTLSFGKEVITGTVKGVTPAFASIQKIHILQGRFIDALDLEQERKVLVIDNKQAEELPGNRHWESIIGKNVKVGAFLYKVIGIYKKEENFGEVSFYAPFTTVRSIYSKGMEYESILFSFHGLETEQENEDFQRRYISIINSHHGAAPDDYNAIYLWNRFTMTQGMIKGGRIISTALWILGLFTLLSGIVGVSNIMLISVKERTHEFGIRKAIGAKPGSILRLIIAESIAVTTFFGYIGMVLGLVANEVMDRTLGSSPIEVMESQITMFKDTVVGVDVAIEATLVMIIAGTIAGLIPARKAAGVKPIEALRAE